MAVFPGNLAVIAEGPSQWPVRQHHRAEVECQRARVIVIMHTALDHEGNKCLSQITAPVLLDKGEVLLPESLELRRKHLMAYVREEINAAEETDPEETDPEDDFAARLPAALSRAFDRMNGHMTTALPDLKQLPDASWRCQYNASVIIVDDTQVVVAGDADCQVMLVRDGGKKMLTRSRMGAIVMHRRGNPLSLSVTPLCFLNRENLVEGDQYLAVYSSGLVLSVSEDNIPAVLETRAKHLGLEKACTQFVDYGGGSVQRLLVVVPLKVAHRRVAVKELGVYRCPSSSDDDDDDVVVVVDNDVVDDEEYLDALYPISDDSHDACWRGTGRTSIRTVQLFPGQVDCRFPNLCVCKFMSFKLVISLGRYAGPLLPSGKPIDAATQFIVTSAGSSGDVALGYKLALDKVPEGVRYIAFTGVDCGLPASEAAAIGVGAIIQCGREFEEVHFVLPRLETWRAWVAATDLLPYRNKQQCWGIGEEN